MSITTKKVKTKPLKTIRKISTAMERGYKIAKENRIKQVTGDFIVTEEKYDRQGNYIEDKVCGACALGMVAIGLFGVEGAKDYNEDKVMRHLGLYDEKNACLPKKLKVLDEDELESGDYTMDVQTVIIEANDDAEKKIPVIVKSLKACKL